ACEKLLKKQHALFGRFIAPVLDDRGYHDYVVSGDLRKMDILLGQLERKLREFLIAREDREIRTRADISHFANVRVLAKQRRWCVVNPRVGFGRLNSVSQMARLLQNRCANRFQSVIEAQN